MSDRERKEDVLDLAGRQKESERTNTRPRKAVADLTRDKQIRVEVSKGNF